MFEAANDLAVDRHLILAQRLRARRLELDLTQKQVVTRLTRRGVRTTNKTLSSFEHGAGVDICRLPDLAAALECTVTYLLGLTDHPRQWEPDGTLAVGRPDQLPHSRPPRVLAGGSLILGPDIPARTPRG